MKGEIVALVVVATLFLCLSGVKEVRGQQFSHPAFMLLWRSTVGAEKRVVDLRRLMEPLLNPLGSALGGRNSPPVEREETEKEKREDLFDFVAPEDVLELLRGDGPLGFIEVQSASSSFNRPLFDYDRLVQAAYNVEFKSWENQVNGSGPDGWDKWGLYSREERSPRLGAARQKRSTDGNGYEENWIGRTGVSPFKITKKVDKVSPKLVHSAFNTNQVGEQPDVFEVIVFFRLQDNSSSPYTIIRLHHAILSEYEVVVRDDEYEGGAPEEVLWFEYARMDYAWVSTINGACTAAGCPPNATSTLNCRLGILYDFPVDPVFPGCPSSYL